jgi:hypothetical protein
VDTDQGVAGLEGEVVLRVDHGAHKLKAEVLRKRSHHLHTRAHTQKHAVSATNYDSLERRKRIRLLGHAGGHPSWNTT